MVWPHLKILWHGKDNSAGDNEKCKKERETEGDGKITSMNGHTWSGDSLKAAEDREGWNGIVAMSSAVPRRQPRLRD